MRNINATVFLLFIFLSLIQPAHLYSQYSQQKSQPSSDVHDIIEYGTYKISNTANEHVIQVSGNQTFNEKYLDNAAIGLAMPEISTGINLKRWQEWHIIYHSRVNNVTYYQLRNLNSGLLLDAGAGAGKPVTQKRELSEKKDQQLWSIEETGQDQQYRISNKANGLYLALSSKGSIASTELIRETNAPPKTTVVLERKADTDQQKWNITKLPADSYRDAIVTNFFNRTQGSVAFDQGNSIPLSDGRVLWVTQDAWHDHSMSKNGNLQGNHTISYTNSIIIQPSAENWSPDAPMMTADGRSNGDMGNLIPKQKGKQWSWPSAGVQIGSSVFIHNREGHGLGTADDHQAIYKLDAVTPTHWNVERLSPGGLSASEKLVCYANGMVKADDDFVYVFGSRTDPGSFGFSTFLHVARFPQKDPLSWTFWNGSQWVDTATIDSTAHINTGLGTNYVAYINGKYVHLSMDQAFYCGIPLVNMYISTATNPTGPFTPRKLVYTFTEFYKGYNARVYTPLIHTHAHNGKNELLLTYSMNYGACPGQNDPLTEKDGTLDPYYYRIKGVRVPYERIGL